MTVTRETLMAYVDGELAPDEERRVATEVAKDPALNAYVEQQKELAAKLRSAFAPVLEEPIPARIERAVRETKMPSHQPALSLVRRLQRLWSNTGRAGSTWIPAGALAAGLALGIVLAGSFETDTDLGTQGGALVARGELARVLTAELASEQVPDTVSAARIGVSFMNKDGAFCRSFETRAGARGAAAGIACLADGDWQIAALASAAPSETGGFTTAAGEMPPTVRSALNEMISGDPLNAEQERAARNQGWTAQ
jgi:hypothetical protein